MKYFGIQKERLNGIEEEKEYFAKLREIIRKELSDTTIRSPRSIKLIYQTLSVRIHFEKYIIFYRRALIVGGLSLAFA